VTRREALRNWAQLQASDEMPGMLAWVESITSVIIGAIAPIVK